MGLTRALLVRCHSKLGVERVKRYSGHVRRFIWGFVLFIDFVMH